MKASLETETILAVEHDGETYRFDIEDDGLAYPVVLDGDTYDYDVNEFGPLSGEVIRFVELMTEREVVPLNPE